MNFKLLIVIMMSAALVNNYVLSKFLAICPFLGVSRERKGAIGMSMALIFVMLLATAVTWPIYHFILDPNDLVYLQTIVFILIIAVFVQLTEIIMKKFLPSLYILLGVYLPLMTTNCALFALTLMNIGENYTFLESMVNALGVGLGFFLAIIIFSGIREHTQNADPPESFKGIPLTLISAAILSLAFFGFSGIVENLFG